MRMRRTKRRAGCCRSGAPSPPTYAWSTIEVLSTYNVRGPSLSRASTDRTDEYLAWGLRYLAGGESPRVRGGDYLSTSPVSAAVSARSLAGVRRSMWSAIRHGRPGPPFAVVYAALGTARILVRSALAPVR